MKTKNATLIYLDQIDWTHFRWIALTQKRTASGILGELLKEYLAQEENKKIVDHFDKLGTEEK